MEHPIKATRRAGTPSPMLMPVAILAECESPSPPLDTCWFGPAAPVEELANTMENTEVVIVLVAELTAVVEFVPGGNVVPPEEAFSTLPIKTTLTAAKLKLVSVCQHPRTSYGNLRSRCSENLVMSGRGKNGQRRGKQRCQTDRDVQSDDCSLHEI